MITIITDWEIFGVIGMIMSFLGLTTVIIGAVESTIKSAIKEYSDQG